MYTQAGRSIQVETPLGPDVMLLETYRGREGVSTPFHYEAWMVSESASVDLKALLRKPIVVRTALPDGSVKILHGLANRAVQLDRLHGLTAYKVDFVPSFWFLTLSSNCRIFQNKTVPEIVEQVFRDQGISDYRLQLQGSYQKLEYCVQYRETDFNFVSRLMEQEGIYYFFEHTPQKHLLVLADSAAPISYCAQKTVHCSTDAGTQQPGDVVLNLERVQSVSSGKVALTDYDFEKPSTSLEVSVAGTEKGEIYDYPGKYLTRQQGDRYAKLWLDAEEAKLHLVSGDGNCRAFQAGYKFDLKDHYRADANQTYLLLSVECECSINSYRSTEEERFDFRNTFEAIPHSVRYRPQRLTPKPVVYGSQTAVVVGPSGSEIHTDQHGRVKIQFHWDREGRKNENSSCWIRVSQPSAGAGFGGIIIPRIGQEVIVDFLEGDPDRPIVTGRVYNGQQQPPYTLPGNQTQSGIKTRSSMGGGGYNELRMEDSKGREEFHLFAEKDRTEVVDKGDQTVTLNMGNQSLTIKLGDQTTDVALGKILTKAMQSIELKVGQSSVKLDQTGVTIKGLKISIEGTMLVEAKAPLTKVNGDAMVKIQGGVVMIN